MWSVKEKSQDDSKALSPSNWRGELTVKWNENAWAYLGETSRHWYNTSKVGVGREGSSWEKKENFLCPFFWPQISCRTKNSFPIYVPVLTQPCTRALSLSFSLFSSPEKRILKERYAWRSMHLQFLKLWLKNHIVEWDQDKVESL